MKPVFIYCLALPESGTPYYVGASVNPKIRYGQHLARPQCATGQRLRASGQKPEMFIIEECTEADAAFWENYWINQLRCWGLDLENHDKKGGYKNRHCWFEFHGYRYRALLTPNVCGWEVVDAHGNIKTKLGETNFYEALRQAKAYIKRCAG